MTGQKLGPELAETPPLRNRLTSFGDVFVAKKDVQLNSIQQGGKNSRSNCFSRGLSGRPGGFLSQSELPLLRGGLADYQLRFDDILGAPLPLQF